MQIKENFSLKHLNTFGIDVNAQYFVPCNTIEEIKEVLQIPDYIGLPKLIMGGGSNILFTKNFEGLIIKPKLKGISIIEETESTVIVEAQAGEVWDTFVQYCVERNWGGVENLALIPGHVGASPIQNIGAYGVEIEDVFYNLKALDLDTNKIKVFKHADCNFSYRDSIFKQDAKNKYIILSVQYKLSKNPAINIEYGAIRTELKERNIDTPTIKDIYEAVCAIRTSKLPNPVELGNAGSFFKNPYIFAEHYFALKEKYPSIVAYPEQEVWKVAAGWLIDQCGWKGYKHNNAGVHAKQALVLVNYGQATGNEIIALSKEIQKSVFEKFKIEIKPEVNFI